MRDSGAAYGGVVIKGANETALYLKNFERDIYDVLEKQVKEILKRTQSSAQGRYPQGSWRVSFGVMGKWPTGEVTTTGGSSRGYASWSEAPAGVKASIFDTFGRRTAPSQMKSPQARATGESLQAKFGPPQRFLWPAWLDNRDRSMREIQQAFDDAERALQMKLNGA